MLEIRRPRCFREMNIREQRFLVSTEPFYAGLWSSFVALLTPRSRALTTNSGYLFRSERSSPYLFRTVDSRQFRLPGKSLFGSMILHGAAVALAFRVAQMPPVTMRVSQFTRVDGKIYYFPPPRPSETLPRITPAGPGGTPGHGVKPQEKPLLASSAFHVDLRVISNPVHPDNNHQTIIQPSSPPDLIIKQDLKLPNVVLGNPMVKPKAPLQFATDPLKPNAPQTSTADVAAPQLTTIDPGQIPALSATVQQPKLPIVPLAAPRALPGSSSASTPGGRTGASDGNPGDPSGLLILGTDPAEAGASISLPPGNRFGAFSISSTGGGPGSPGGVPGGSAEGGFGGPGSGGDESTGLGGGRAGGGGEGSISAAAPVSVSGSGVVGGTHGSLESIAAESVFPVISNPRLRRNSLVISTGSAGGGGLGVYQALPCAKIYTIFVPMEPGNWTLQYCQPGALQSASRSSSAAATIQSQGELLPPDPVEKFDFHRLPVPTVNAHGMLVLRGFVREDGSVDKVEIYQGVLRENDDRALAALKKWKFSPARRDGKPVTIEILVGIQFPGAATH